MAEELATVVRIGSRNYRKYKITNLDLPELKFKSSSLNLLEEDDGESEEEKLINVDFSDFEECNAQKYPVNNEPAVVETGVKAVRGSMKKTPQTRRGGRQNRNFHHEKKYVTKNQKNVCGAIDN